MSGFDDGPLTGAPLNKPKTAMKGDDCPPVILQTGEYVVVGGQASTSLKIYGVFTDLGGPGGVVAGLKKTNQTNELPQPLLAAITPGGPNELDTYTIIMDTQDAGVDSPFAVQVRAGNGCVAEVEVGVIFP
jgi:hypothetical protein